MIQQKQSLLTFLENTLCSLIDSKLIEDSITTKGRTQKSELIIMDLVDTAFSLAKEEGIILNFVKASSQQPYDFRYSLPSETLDPVSEDYLNNSHKLEKIPSNVGLLEVKKTDNGTLMLNDTVPMPSSHYLVFCFKKNNRVIQLFSGDSIIEGLNIRLKKPGIDCPYKDIFEYRNDILALRKKIGYATRINLSIPVNKIPGSAIFTYDLDKK